MRNMNSEDLKNTIHYQVPKWLFDLLIQNKISLGAYKTYVLMFDRLRVSQKNGWIDENGLVYIKYSYDEMQEDLKCSRQAVSNNLKQLEELDLISKVRCFNSSSVFYLKIYSVEKVENTCQENFTSKEDLTSKEKLTISSKENLTNDSKENLTTSSLNLLDASKNNSSKNNTSKNNYSNNNIGEKLATENISSELKEKLSEYIVYRKEIRKPINSYRVITAILNRLGKDFANEQHLIDSLDFSMSNGWQGVFVNKELEKKQARPVEQESYASMLLRKMRENVEDVEEVEYAR